MLRHGKVLGLAAFVLAALLASGPARAADEASGDDLSNLLKEAPAAAAQETKKTDQWWRVHFEGELKANLWAQTSDGENWKTTNRLDLMAEKTMGSLKILGRLKLDYQDLEANPDTRVDPRELYARYRFQPSWAGYLDVTAGKKIVYWGKGDEVRPLDIVNPQDMTSYLFYDMNDRKTGTLGLFVDCSLNRNVTVEAFWSPYFQKSWTPELGDYFEPAKLRALANAGIAVGSAETPDEFSDLASAGARLKLSVARFDIGLYAYQGYGTLPTYEVSQLAVHPLVGLPILPTRVTARYFRTTMFGADFERAVGDYVLRGEVAWLADGNREYLDWDSNPALLLKHPTGTAEAQKMQYVLGLDRNDLFVRHLFVNVQYLGEHILDYESGFSQEETTHGMTLTVRYSLWDSLLQLSYRGVADFTNHTYRNCLKGTYKINNWSELTLGLITYHGDSDTMFGQYEKNDFAYTQVKFIF